MDELTVERTIWLVDGTTFSNWYQNLNQAQFLLHGDFVQWGHSRDFRGGAPRHGMLLYYYVRSTLRW
jgi:hypothetical protein